VVTAASLTDLELFGLLNEDEEISYGFDEPDELTHARPCRDHQPFAGRRALRLVVPW
jgi:hypothetical protein